MFQRRALLALLITCSALAASSTSAVAANFHSGSSTSSTIVSGSNTSSATFQIHTASGVIELICTESGLSGTFTGSEVTTITLHPVYAKCSVVFLGEASSETTGCNYQLSAPFRTVAVACEAGKKIKFTASGCSVTIASQTMGGFVSYTNGPSSSLTTEFNLSASYASSGSFCTLLGLPSTGTVEVRGSYRNSGFVDVSGSKGAETKIWVE